MKIVRERLERDLARMADFGGLANGGVTRPALGSADRAARHYFAEAMRDAGLAVTVDGVGNMRGRRPGDDELPAVMLGSHLDSVPNGGRFDGVVGVVAALEVVRSLNDAGTTTRRPIDIVNFTAEESSRFRVATLGSKALVGALEEKDLDEAVDSDGITFRQALRKAGYEGRIREEERLKAGSIHAFLELHIEQGPTLEHSGAAVGLVTAVAAPTRFRVLIRGRADHSGTTPMGMRRDALAGASELVLGVERIVSKEGGGKTVGTVGYLTVQPGVMNVVPEMVELGIDLRDVDPGRKQLTSRKIIHLMGLIAQRRELEIEHRILADEMPISLSPRILVALERAASDAGITYRKLPSGAGHDAMNLAMIAEVGMIFVPSVGGISHNIAEKSRIEDICLGTELLLRTTYALAQE